MGAVMTRVLFRPPVVSTYSDVQGEILFITKNVQTNLGEMWQEPLIYLTTKTKNCIPAVHLKRPGARFTILMSHANMEDLGIAVRCAAELAVDLEEDLFVYEYSGYGISTGKPSEKNCYADIDAAYDYLVHNCKLDPGRIVLFGRSVGCGPSVDLASRKHCGGLIFQSGFLSVIRLLKQTASTTIVDIFPNVDKISSVSCPVLVMHGKKDEIVPFEHAVKIFNKSPVVVEPLWIEHGNHNNLNTTYKQVVFPKIREFLEQILNDSATFDLLSSSNVSASTR